MIVYRAKFAPTIWAARQLVSHGHIRVNGVKCNIASRRVRRRRRDRARPEGAGNGAGDRGAEPRRARHPRICRARRHRQGRPSPACRRSTKCPIRCGWSRTWSSNSTRADRFGAGQDKRAALAGPPFFVCQCPIVARRKRADLASASAIARAAVVELVVEPVELDQLDLLAGRRAARSSISRDCVDADVGVEVAVEQQHRRLDRCGVAAAASLRRRAARCR